MQLMTKLIYSEIIKEQSFKYFKAHERVCKQTLDYSFASAALF